MVFRRCNESLIIEGFTFIEFVLGIKFTNYEGDKYYRTIKRSYIIHTLLGSEAG